MFKKSLFAVALCLVFCFAVYANTPVKSIEEEYYDFLSLSGRATRSYQTYRNLSNNNYTNVDSFWKTNINSSTKKISENSSYTIYNPQVYTSCNTLQPLGQNDGSLWQGKGLNAQLKAGVSYSYRDFTFTLKPEVNFSQNADFKTVHDTYGYFWSTLDLVQRYGDEALFTFNWGDSQVRYTRGPVTVSFGTEYTWVGPMYLNPVLMSNNAPAYPRLEIGLNSFDLIIPRWNLNLGKFEAYFSSGVVKKSEYATYYPNVKTAMSIFSLSYQPSFIDGFTFSAHATANAGFEKEDIMNVIMALFSHENNSEDMKMSFAIDWLLPKSGFEAYAEVGIDDYCNGWFNLFHSMVFQAGFKKVININPDKDVYGELIGEFGNMEMSRDAFSEWPLFFYTHSGVANSHTNEGQLLGAGSGWGGNSQLLKFNMFYPKGMSSIYLQRSNPDNNYVFSGLFYDLVENKGNYRQYFYRYRLFLDLGLSTTYFLNENLTLSCGFIGQYITKNYYNEGLNEDFMHNFQFSAGVIYSL